MALSTRAKKLFNMLANQGTGPDGIREALIDRRNEAETLQQVADRLDAIALMVTDLQDWAADVKAFLENFATQWDAFAVSGGNGTTTAISPATIPAVPDDHKYTDDGTTEGTPFPDIS